MRRNRFVAIVVLTSVATFFVLSFLVAQTLRGAL